ncbi:ABC transporter permease [Alloacidobacterium dinghuense]|uniref:ABC transporter permease n=1 Tax=Alloacidobacterium dinghuense TaxID=2763107 RepID=A0A7G8BP23_9BACT|nr:ABC transporter permease [Alloacidobacterium dinghuense]QNI34293.1 ABC transporter permease [Alloacidobacterium dinghuense]
MTTIWGDFRYAFRQLRKSPDFALTAVLTLALGIGVNAAVFTVFNQVLLRTMPVQKPGELVMLEEQSKYETGGLNSYGGDNPLYFAYPAYQTLRDGDRTLRGLAAAAVQPASIVTAKDADQNMMQLVSGNYFSVMGLSPVLGRLLIPADDVYHAANPVAVLSADYWRSRFGGDPSILNQAIRVNGVATTVVGVVPHTGLMDDNRAAIFLPITMQPQLDIGHGDQLGNALDRWLNIIGRLSPGVARAQAEEELNTLWWNWRRDTLNLQSHHIGDKTDWLKTHLFLTNGSRGISLYSKHLGSPIRALQAMALVVLLIACANVANLLLVKAAGKHADLALRAALGANRRRIFQQVLAEGTLLGAAGAVAGLGIGWLSLKLLLKFVPDVSSLHDLLSSSMDWHAITFCALAGIVTSVLFSLAPALVSMRVELLRALHGQTGAVSAKGSWLRNLFVTGEIALSLALLVAATVFSWTLYQLRNVDPGFGADHVLTFQVDSSALGKSGPQVENDYESIRNAALRQPGARSVVYARGGLITGDESGRNITVAGYETRDNDPSPDFNWVSSGFFSTMQIPLLAGREFSGQDTAALQKVAIVDEAFVKHYFDGDVRKALRGQFAFGAGNDVRPDIQIVGVIPTIRAISLEEPPPVPFIYLPYAQVFAAGGHYSRSRPATFFIRTSGDPGQFASMMRTIVHDVDRNLPVTGVETMREHLDNAISQTRLMSMLTLSMGGLALTLAAVGLYGVLSFAVAQRTREIGIRIAMGADKGNISGLVLRHVGGLAAVGLAMGSALAWVAVRLLRQNGGLQPAPVGLQLLAGLVLVVVILAAGYLPARRATSVDPMEALRAE